LSIAFNGSCATYANSSPDVFGEDNALELDHEEVDELLKVIEEAFKRLLWDDKVFAGTHAGGQTVSKESMAQDLSRSRDYEMVSHLCVDTALVD
jgi:ketopantoate reductase